MRVRHGDDHVARRIQQPFKGLHLRRVRDDDHSGAASLRFLDVAERFFEHFVIGCTRPPPAKVLVDQRDRSVLHFAGRIALRVDVRNFLQLERALECDRVVDATTQVQEITMVLQLLRQRLDLTVRLQGLLDANGQLLEFPDQFPSTLGRERAPRLPDRNCEQVQRHQLAGKRLR